MAGAGSSAYLQNLANSAPFQPPIDYRKTPLGSLPGEEGLASPYNQTAQDAVVRVRNWSALIKRKVLKDSVSGTRGGILATTDKASPYYGRAVEELRRMVKEDGRDMNWYVEEAKPQVFAIRFDNKRYEIEPTLYDGVGNVITQKDLEAIKGDVGDIAPKWYTVPSGVWDLYMGNYQRMNSRDFQERTREMEATQSRGLAKFVIQEGNGFGLLEFMREEIVVTAAAVDRDRVSAADLLEV